MTEPKNPANKKKTQAPPQEPAEAKPDLAAAAKAEAQAPVTMDSETPLVKVMTWREMDLRIPPSAEDWPVEVEENFEDNRLVAAIRGILGDEQWAKVKTTVRPKLRDIKDLSDAIGREYGFTDTGE
ncbi:hypothetical protein [Streptomonospora salina]|uniref:hypothetical protein n=1 Tax=Streptomonospora salina TaxID=104205 RepID=UPI0031E80429